LASQIKVEEKPMSKHAARRQKKKKMVVVSQPDQSQAGQPIMGMEEPTLDDL